MSRSVEFHFYTRDEISFTTFFVNPFIKVKGIIRIGSLTNWRKSHKSGFVDSSTAVLARQTLLADLPGRLARQTCPADLPGRLAGQTCPADFLSILKIRIFRKIWTLHVLTINSDLPGCTFRQNSDKNGTSTT
jgi:hypothetical protein